MQEVGDVFRTSVLYALPPGASTDSVVVVVVVVVVVLTGYICEIGSL